jgi:hypothetical protein
VASFASLLCSLALISRIGGAERATTANRLGNSFSGTRPVGAVTARITS